MSNVAHLMYTTMARRLDKAEKALVSANNVGETLNLKKAVCREFDINDIYKFIKRHGAIPMSWGLHNAMIPIKNKALRFNVQGHHHKGYVYIVLNFMDTFDIYYTTQQDTIVKKSNDVYIDSLIETIDIDVEKIPEYTR